MYKVQDQEFIKILVADDDEDVLNCYREAFGTEYQPVETQVLDELAAELFDWDTAAEKEPKFDVTACNQGEDAIKH